MGCFDNIIGIDGTCDATAPTSGLYLNDLGITLDQLNDIAQADQDSGRTLANRQIEFASKVVSNLVLGHFNDRLKTKSVLDGARLGRANDNLNTQLAAANYHGVEIELCNRNSFMDFAVNSLSLQVNFDGPVEIKVFDLKQGKEIDSITVEAVNGCVVDVDINKVYKSDRKTLHLLFAYDATAIDSIQHVLFPGACTTCHNGCLPINTHLNARSAKLATIDTPIRSNVKSAPYTGGISLNYSINCNHEYWMCAIKNMIALPILYKAGGLISEYALESQRDNATTMIDGDMWKMRAEKAEFRFRESMDNIIKSINLPDDRHCFQCNSPVKYAINLP